MRGFDESVVYLIRRKCLEIVNKKGKNRSSFALKILKVMSTSIFFLLNMHSNMVNIMVSLIKSETPYIDKEQTDKVRNGIEGSYYVAIPLCDHIISAQSNLKTPSFPLSQPIKK